MATLKIQNTLENTKEEFIPIDSANVRIYACGPTVYDYAHIGNARMAVVNDLLVRLLRTCFSILLSNINYIRFNLDYLIGDRLCEKEIKNFNQSS